MKRWLSLLLVIAVFCALALGSGHKRPIDTSEPDVSALKPKPLPASADELQPDETPAGPTFEETVLYERDGVRLTASGITYEDAVPSLRWLLENGSDRYVRAACEGLDVDGYWFSLPMAGVAAPGGRVFGKAALDPDALALCGVKEIAQLDLDFVLSDEKTGRPLPGAERVRLFTDAAREKAYTPDKTGRVIYYEDGVELTLKGRDGRSPRSAGPVLCVGNTGDAAIRVTLAGFSVNGAGFEAKMDCTVPPGRVALCAVPADRSALSERDLWPVERCELRLEIYDASSGDLLAAPGAVRIDYADLRPVP